VTDAPDMRRTALVVEDDAAIRHLITAALGGEWSAVLQAPDGQTALATAADARPDVILLDIGLPDIDGLQVLQTLKQDAELRAIPVVMVTAWADPDMVRQAVDRGAADYVCKPFAVDDLLARVEAAASPALPSGAPGAANDPVTGLPAREHLDTVLERQVTAARRTGRPFGVVLADLDETDRLRALHGPEAADDVLRAVAKRFRRCAGVSDVVVRYDGHALALVLPGAGADTALRRAEALRAELAAAPVDTATVAVRVTACFGVASHEPTEHADETLARAIDALCGAMAAGADSIRGDASDGPSPAATPI
jgi:diguanylate cyclase (GGDEF)-like protein